MVIRNRAFSAKLKVCPEIWYRQNLATFRSTSKKDFRAPPHPGLRAGLYLLFCVRLACPAQTYNSSCTFKFPLDDGERGSDRAVKKWERKLEGPSVFRLPSSVFCRPCRL